LNYNNPAVVTEFEVGLSYFIFSSAYLVLTHVTCVYYVYIRYILFKDILTHWLKLGINGFRLANTQYLTEDPQLRDESRSILPVEANDYQSLIHIYTRDRPENAAVLAKWQEIVHNETNGQGYVFANELIIINI